MASAPATPRRVALTSWLMLLTCACQAERAVVVDILPQRYPNRLEADDSVVRAVLQRPPLALGLSTDARVVARAAGAEPAAPEVGGELTLVDVDGDGENDAVATFEVQALRDAGLGAGAAFRLELRAESARETWVGNDRLFDRETALLVLPPPSGPHAVGTAELLAVDASRPSADGVARHLLVRLWYPARPSERQPAPYILAAERAARSARAVYMPLSPELIERTHAFAVEHAAPAPPEPRAALLLSPGWRAPVELYGALAAELSSHGYLVFGVQHPGGPGALGGDDGAPSPEPWELVPDQRTAEAWARDLGYLASWLTDPDAVAEASLDEGARGAVREAVAQHDGGRIAALGHCFGGSAALLADAQSALIGASIALESAVLGDARWLAERARASLLSSPEHAAFDAELDDFLLAAGPRSRAFELAGSRYADYADTRWLFADLLARQPDLGAEGYGLGPIGAERGHALISAQVRAFASAAWGDAAELEPAALPGVAPHRASGPPS